MPDIFLVNCATHGPIVDDKYGRLDFVIESVNGHTNLVISVNNADDVDVYVDAIATNATELKNFAHVNKFGNQRKKFEFSHTASKYRIVLVAQRAYESATLKACYFSTTLDVEITPLRNCETFVIDRLDEGERLDFSVLAPSGKSFMAILLNMGRSDAFIQSADLYADVDSVDERPLADYRWRNTDALYALKTIKANIVTTNVEYRIVLLACCGAVTAASLNACFKDAGEILPPSDELLLPNCTPHGPISVEKDDILKFVVESQDANKRYLTICLRNAMDADIFAEPVFDDMTADLPATLFRHREQTNASLKLLRIEAESSIYSVAVAAFRSFSGATIIACFRDSPLSMTLIEAENLFLAAFVQSDFATMQNVFDDYRAIGFDLDKKYDLMALRNVTLDVDPFNDIHHESKCRALELIFYLYYDNDVTHQTVKWLMDNGAAPHYPLENSRCLNIDYFIMHDRDSIYNSPLKLCLSWYGDANIAELLLSRGQQLGIAVDMVNENSPLSSSALFASIWMGRDVMEMLLNYGGDVNKIEKSESLLMLAVLQFTTTIATLLLERGAIVDIVNYHNNWTALTYAAAYNRSEHFNLLIAYGANKTLGCEPIELSYPLCQ